ncbi:MAG TPA: hypothetical protein VK550_19725 [Polyangiaceae bacterium]|nr:hypothetical protein [Polyangiaceae bacterium]
MSDPENRLAPDASFDRANVTIQSPGQVPKAPPLIDSPVQTSAKVTEQFVILYVVGHGVQRGLVDGKGVIVEEEDVANEIKKLRNGHPTLIVWDVCFARSMLKIGASAQHSWPANFIHVFSCQPFERTWHSGPGATPARTVFSSVLCDVVAELDAQSKGLFDWKQLEQRLQTEFGWTQKPTIEPVDAKWQPRDFELAKWLGVPVAAPSTMNRPAPAPAAIDLR